MTVAQRHETPRQASPWKDRAQRRHQRLTEEERPPPLVTGTMRRDTETHRQEAEPVSSPFYRQGNRGTAPKWWGWGAGGPTPESAVTAVMPSVTGPPSHDLQGHFPN